MDVDAAWPVADFQAAMMKDRVMDICTTPIVIKPCPFRVKLILVTVSLRR